MCSLGGKGMLDDRTRVLRHRDTVNPQAKLVSQMYTNQAAIR